MQWWSVVLTPIVDQNLAVDLHDLLRLVPKASRPPQWLVVDVMDATLLPSEATDAVLAEADQQVRGSAEMVLERFPTGIALRLEGPALLSHGLAVRLWSRIHQTIDGLLVACDAEVVAPPMPALEQQGVATTAVLEAWDSTLCAVYTTDADYVAVLREQYDAADLSVQTHDEHERVPVGIASDWVMSVRDGRLWFGSARWFGEATRQHVYPSRC